MTLGVLIHIDRRLAAGRTGPVSTLTGTTVVTFAPKRSAGSRARDNIRSRSSLTTNRRKTLIPGDLYGMAPRLRQSPRR